MNSPAVLLLLTGLFLGLTFPFGKLASEAGISPVVWAWIIAAGSGICLLLLRAATGKLIHCSTTFLRYYILSSLISLVIPNILIFTVVPKLGAGYTSLMFTLSPVFTVTLSSIWNVRMPNKLGMFAILLGFIGATLVALTRGELGSPAHIGWVIAGLGIPLSLAMGNLYRTMAWPETAAPMELAAGSNLSAALVLSVLILALPEIALPSNLTSSVWLIVAAVAASTAMFTVFFRLQLAGGPTYLSQIGYVAAAVALLTGTLFLDERYESMTWFGAAVIIAGLALSIYAQRSTVVR